MDLEEAREFMYVCMYVKYLQQKMTTTTTLLKLSIHFNMTKIEFIINNKSLLLIPHTKVGIYEVKNIILNFLRN